MNERIDPPGADSEGGAKPEDAGLSVDEKFAKLVAEVGGPAPGPLANAPKEDAARTRQLRAEWSRNPPQATGWRTDGPRTGDPSSPADPAGGDRPRRKRRWVRWVACGCTVAVAAGAYAGLKAASAHRVTPVNATPAGTLQPWAASPAASFAASPSPSPSPDMSYANPDDAYFAGSPALNWQDNSAGFSIPRAVETNDVSSDDIETGYRLLEKLMEAGNLDDTILDGGPTTDFSTLLDPHSGLGSIFATDLAHPSYQHDPTLLVTRFDPKTTRLLGHTVKVSGEMSAAAGPQRDTVLLTANHLFAYAVGPASGDTSEDGRTVVHRTIQIEVVSSDSDYVQTPGKAWIYQYGATIGNDSCFDYDGYVNPQFTYSGALPNATGTLDPYATGQLLVPSNSPIPSPTSTDPACVAGGTT
jgi:hypothetical protein